MNRAVAIGLAGMLLASPMVGAREAAPTGISKGAQIGVVSLLDPEVAHYHAAKKTEDNFLKLHAVTWSVDDMLNSAVKGVLEPMGLTPVPLALTDRLAHEREDCFVETAFAKGLPKSWSKTCGAALAELAADAGVKALIVLSPGLNNAGHAGNARDGLSESLRGWGFFTRGSASADDKPTLFDETEMLLMGVGADGTITLIARKWGGTLSIAWQSYVRPADPKEVNPQQLDELQPLFAAVLDRQSKELLDQVHLDQ
jgi:hypothetical protein